MTRFASGRVLRIVDERNGLVRVVVELEEEERLAVAFPDVVGAIEPGDAVVLNTTAVDLALGTGGEDFVVVNLTKSQPAPSSGHILKLRYTPWQIDRLVAEAPESPHHDRLASAIFIDSMPVVAFSVHSQLAAAAAVIKHRRPSTRVAYVMTDDAALPLALSDLVSGLVESGALDVTITAGNAFGGDLETVNIFSALVTARLIAGADVTLAGPGPGVVGTGTTLGHSGMQQAHTLAATVALGGRPVAALRISFADPRERHRIVSHHTISALGIGCVVRSSLAVPLLEPAKLEAVRSRLEEEGLAVRHDILIIDAADTKLALDKFGLAPTTMERTVAEDPEFFEAAGAAGAAALELLEGRAGGGS